MYSKRTGLVFGFHGCDISVRDKVVAGTEFLIPSENKWDWLGHGYYFWENNLARAAEYSKDLLLTPERTAAVVSEPSVLGAVIELGNCLDLVDTEFIPLLEVGYNILKETTETSAFENLRNIPHFKSRELLRRDLDCAVIEAIHSIMEQSGEPPFDSVRAVFFEGDEIYPNAGFRRKNHIQICVRNPNCIKGFFIPREADPDYPAV